MDRVLICRYVISGMHAPCELIGERNVQLHVSLISMSLIGELLRQLLWVQTVTSATRKLAAPIKFQNVITWQAIVSLFLPQAWSLLLISYKNHNSHALIWYLLLEWDRGNVSTLYLYTVWTHMQKLPGHFSNGLGMRLTPGSYTGFPPLQVCNGGG